MIAVCVLAIVGTVVFYGQPKGPVTDDPSLARTWTAEGLARGAVSLDLRPDGRYLIVTSAGAVAECGHWRSEGGTMHMRVRGSPGESPAARPLLLWQPALRAIHLECPAWRATEAGGEPPACERWTLTEHVAVPAAMRSDPRVWHLAPAQAAAPSLSPRQEPWVSRRCDLSS